MKRRPVGRTSWFSIVLIIAAVALWALDQKRAGEKDGKSPPAASSRSSPAGKGPEAVEITGKYEVHRNCRLVEARNNDGDSFQARLPDGRVHEFRLYFVDAPESAFKRYRDGDTNHARIRDQAADLGGITPEQAVEAGKQAKSFTLDLLGSRPFTLFTAWDSPYNDKRYHAFVELAGPGDQRWLHERLVGRGLVRIHTKAADLPDGTPASRQRERLREIERVAKKNGVGAWGM
jgi:endonuclease YncB( thermonuclease family)